MQADTAGPRKEMSQGMLAVLFSAPAVLIIASTILVPFGIAVFLSLHRWNLKRPGREKFIGLENYIDWLGDSDFWGPLQTTITFAIGSVVVILVVSLLVALLLNEEFPGRGVLRAMLLIPWAIPSVVNALLWKWLLNPQYGLVNAVALELGIITEYQNVLGSMPSVMIWLIIAYAWIHIPLATLLLLSGLQTIPDDIYESAIVDGAGIWQRFAFITFPLLRPMLSIVIIFEMIFALKVFDIIFVLTAGGPANATNVLGWQIYTETFRKLDFGAGSSIAMLLGAITLGLAIIFYVFLDRGRQVE
ncbi:MAG: sugar ABC transporter permease [Chloroflexi bacterium]|nr:sugar ABC transporter permease [Chloroflexota bacterium]MCY3581499.1 sugar ABC transporter permease [Chloroflexota bacterium]MCY3715143.1 sugar ABC transporter permease [Chloroflexota bacterium]MDE2650175.1 sugar ABC transporter permease [Chloroflexota bacterium]MXV93940.1 sugar ABC transporter permease [Chloroflexota bacterium]